MAITMWIENIKQAPKLLSVQIAAVSVALGSIPPEVQASMLDAVGVPASRVPAILGILMLLARLVAQPRAR